MSIETIRHHLCESIAYQEKGLKEARAALKALTSMEGTVPAIKAFIPGEPPAEVAVASRRIPTDRNIVTCSPENIQAAINKLRDGDCLVVKPGAFYGPLKVESVPNAIIMAENPGETRISGLWKEADQGKVTWTQKWGAWAAKHGDSFMGSVGDEFLFRYKLVDDLKADKIDHVKKPRFGYAYRGGEIFVILPGDEDPNGKQIKLADKPKQTLIKVSNSPGLKIDGFVIEGSGNTDAIVYDEASGKPVLRNCVFTHCRRAARLPHNSLVEWCEYTYPGFRNFFDHLFDLNGKDGEGIFHLVKDYWASKGNAAIEGGFAESIYEGGSGNCEFRYNLYHGLFDGERLGAFYNSSSHHNVYQYSYDNHWEAENWSADRPTSNLEIHHSLMLDCIAGPCSHQDSTGRGMKGPHYVRYNIIRSTDPERYHPPFLIKLLNLDSLKEPILYEYNYLEQAPGYNEGFGNTNAICYALKKQKVDPSKIILKNNVIYSKGLTKAKGEPDYSKTNVMTETKLNDAALSLLIGEEVGPDWPRPARRAFA